MQCAIAPMHHNKGLSKIMFNQLLIQTEGRYDLTYTSALHRRSTSKLERIYELGGTLLLRLTTRIASCISHNGSSFKSYRLAWHNPKSFWVLFISKTLPDGYLDINCFQHCLGNLGNAFQCAEHNSAQ